MIYIATHKPVEIPQLEKYVTLHVGAELRENWGVLCDNNGDNISSKNGDYCELTGLYWIWKNVKDEYKGLVHYRRFFARNSIRNNEKYIYSYGELQEMLKDADVVLPYVEFFLKNAKDEIMLSSCTSAVFEQMEHIIKTKMPEYGKAFDEFFSGNKCFLFNMLFCSGEIFDRYCEWLFSILFELEDWIQKNNIEYQPRLYGYLAERLLNIWIMHNQLNAVHVGVLNTELGVFKRIQLIRRRITNRIRYKLRRRR